MRTLLLLFVPVLLLWSCKKDDTIPANEDVTQGSRWGIIIGSTPEQVYQQLQTLQEPLHVSSVYQVPLMQYEKIMDFKSDPALYKQCHIHGIDSAGVVSIDYDQSITKIRWSGPDGNYSLDKWPSNTDEYFAVGDAAAVIKAKMSKIFNKWPYNGRYEIALGSKPLSAGFDEEMKKWNMWQFTASALVNAEAFGTYIVSLYFSGGKLSRINIQYTQSPVIIE
ncbi:hypothetical protein SAMN05444266_110188 [Chitinophaga jiangningensis]|uniref:Uncharacterized protein n=1 Tax=Chitinophaga jiangningensis TaxID=1419482 RepID=A0A1M7L9V0_9BACT|nr:hypothetical protein [Chitinophaga jiangningensis]SHM74171.1 hypothetical protein SAMN05444266_110188 [Chitinophaga jiangningensis]